MPRSKCLHRLLVFEGKWMDAWMLTRCLQCLGPRSLLLHLSRLHPVPDEFAQGCAA
jgi:hypothetical protein